MMDRDLAEMYQVEVKRLNEQVKRNLNRFPDSFMFQLTTDEKGELVANCDRFENLKHSNSNPFAFTEQGVAMLSGVLRSNTAVKISIQIMMAFVEMRKILQANSGILQRMDHFELKMADHEQKFEQLFSALEKNNPIPEKGIFFEGQIFDAYSFVADLVKIAKNEIILIDNYIDESVLALLSKRAINVNVTIYTKQINRALQLDLEKHNSQFPHIEIKTLQNTHDRFLLIGKQALYHIGASIKDLGKKWFAFSRMDGFIDQILDQINRQE